MSVFPRVMMILRVVAALTVLGVRVAGAQEQLAYSDRAPRFLAFVDGGVKPVDVQRTAVLNQRLALDRHRLHGHRHSGYLLGHGPVSSSL